MIRRIVGVTGLAAVAIAAAVHSWVAMPLSPPVGELAGQRALEYARASLEGRPVPLLLGDGAPQRVGPVLLTLYVRGAPLARGLGRGDTFGLALRSAIAALRAQLPASVAVEGRLKLDRVIGRGWLSRNVAPLFALGAVPGRDGVGATAGGREALLSADDLLRAEVWAVRRVLPIADVAAGLDPQRVLAALGAALALPRGVRPDHVYRFRAEEYVEVTRGSVVAISAALPPAPPVSRERLILAARAAGDYLIRHLDRQGRFDYEYFPVLDRAIGDGEYSLPRHAGTTSFLAQLYAVDRDPAVRAAAERALGFLAEARPAGCRGPRTCIGEESGALVDLGSSALGLVALVELERGTGTSLYPGLRQGLAEFLLWMQKSSGDFCHLYDPRAQKRDERTQVPYFSGEAAYALALLQVREEDVTRRARLAVAVDRALQYLTHDSYAHLAGQFYVGEDHWTCLALDAGWSSLPARHRERYAAFCDDVATFFRRSQFIGSDGIVAEHPQLAGGYGLSASIMPRLAPVGSRAESVAAVWRLARRRGLAETDRRVSAPREQVLDGVRFLLQRQIDDDGAYFMPSPSAARGGLQLSEVEHVVRIDVVQHAGAAFLAALGLF